MITKNDWDAALEAWVTAERERLGGPPTPEEVVAWTRGELSREDASRVRALLVYYPELTPLLDEPAPRPLRWSRVLPIAASLLIATLGVFAGQARWALAKSREPYVHQARYELEVVRPRGVRAPSPVHDLPAGEERYLLAPGVSEESVYPDYRIDIVDLSDDTPKIVWTASGAQPVDGAFEVSVPRRFLHPGVHRIDIYGLASGRAEALESFKVRVP